MVFLYWLYVGYWEFCLLFDYFVQGVVVECFVVVFLGVGELGGVDVVGECDVGVDVEQ